MNEHRLNFGFSTDPTEPQKSPEALKQKAVRLKEILEGRCYGLKEYETEGYLEEFNEKVRRGAIKLGTRLFGVSLRTEPLVRNLLAIVETIKQKKPASSESSISSENGDKFLAFLRESTGFVLGQHERFTKEARTEEERTNIQRRTEKMLSELQQAARNNGIDFNPQEVQQELSEFKDLLRRIFEKNIQDRIYNVGESKEKSIDKLVDNQLNLIGRFALAGEVAKELRETAEAMIINLLQKGTQYRTETSSLREEPKRQQKEESVRTERWEPTQRTLTVETTEQLKRGLKDAEIIINQGRIVVEGSDDPNPRIITRLIVSASTEDEARKFLQEKGGEFEVRKGNDSISVIGRRQEGMVLKGENVIIGGGRGVFISGDLIGGAIISGGEVLINDQRVDVSRGGTQVIPSIQKEIVLVIPKADRLRYTLETQAGGVEIRKTAGECRVSTSAANVQITDYEGGVSLNSRSGDVEIYRLRGDLSINSISGDINIEDFKGAINLIATSGDINLHSAVLIGRNNNIRATSGDIKIGIANDALLVYAETQSGEIRIPPGNEFVIIREDRPKRERSGPYGHGNVVIASGTSIVSIGGFGGRSFVEGRFGLLEDPENRVNLNSTSGDITIFKI